MKIKKQFYLVLLLTAVLSRTAYSIENVIPENNPENVTAEKMGWPLNYKMVYKEIYSSFRFILLGKKYDIDEIKIIFDLTDNRTKQLFYKAYKAFHSTEFIPGYDTMPVPAVESYNAFITSGSPETARLKSYFKKLYIEKQNEELQRRQEEIYEPQESIRYFTSDRPLYLGFAGISDIQVNQREPQFLSVNPSLRIAYFFKENWKKHNFGFFIDLGYMYCVFDENDRIVREHYLTFTPGLFYKTYSVRKLKSLQFLIGIGPFFAGRIAGADQYLQKYYFKRIMIGADIKFGLLAILPKSKIAITLLSTIRLLSRQTRKDYGSPASSDELRWDNRNIITAYVGLELGIFFKIN